MSESEAPLTQRKIRKAGEEIRKAGEEIRKAGEEIRKAGEEIRKDEIHTHLLLFFFVGIGGGWVDFYNPLPFEFGLAKASPCLGLQTLAHALAHNGAAGRKPRTHAHTRFPAQRFAQP